jgi:uncharacterized membrane protein (UPF0136 family)
VPSLVAGTAFGLLYLTSGYLIQNNKDYGFELATGTSGLLAAAMLPKAIRGGKPVPVVMALLGVSSGIYYARKLVEYY